MVSNTIQCDLTEHFRFFQYSVHAESKNGKQIDSASRRNFLARKGIKALLVSERGGSNSEKEADNIMRQVFASGSFFFTSNAIKGLEAKNMPFDLLDGTTTDGDILRVVSVHAFGKPAALLQGDAAGKGQKKKTGDDMVSMDLRCADCPKAFTSAEALLAHCKAEGHTPVYEAVGKMEQPETNVFLSFVNVALDRALGERMAKWGRDYINPKDFQERDGIKIFRGFRCEFNILKPTASLPPSLFLTVDLRAKIIRTESLLQKICAGKNMNNPVFSDTEKKRINREWAGEVIISTLNRACFPVHEILFDESPDSLMIEELGMSHTTYFAKRKNCVLKYPKVKVMVAVMGNRNNQIIHM